MQVLVPELRLELERASVKSAQVRVWEQELGWELEHATAGASTTGVWSDLLLGRERHDLCYHFLFTDPVRESQLHVLLLVLPCQQSARSNRRRVRNRSLNR